MSVVILTPVNLPLEEDAAQSVIDDGGWFNVILNLDLTQNSNILELIEDTVLMASGYALDSWSYRISNGSDIRNVLVEVDGRIIQIP